MNPKHLIQIKLLEREMKKSWNKAEPATTRLHDAANSTPAAQGQDIP